MKFFVLIYFALIVIKLNAQRSNDFTLTRDIKNFCDDKPKINFCSSQNYRIAREFQRKYDKMITDKIIDIQLKNDKELQKQLELQIQLKKEQEIKSKILKEYQTFFLLRYL
jgi:hypothetical protein